MDKELLDAFSQLDAQLCANLNAESEGRYKVPADVPLDRLRPYYHLLESSWWVSRYKNLPRITARFWWMDDTSGGWRETTASIQADECSYDFAQALRQMFMKKYGHS